MFLRAKALPYMDFHIINVIRTIHQRHIVETHNMRLPHVPV